MNCIAFVMTGRIPTATTLSLALSVVGLLAGKIGLELEEDSEWLWKGVTKKELGVHVGKNI